MTGKICKCGKEFNHTYKGRLYCSLKCASKYNPSRPWNDKQRHYKYVINYGITLDDYNKMFEEQEGRCKICKTHQSEMKKALHVDHNHQTGKVRGLLCHNCNLALGRLKEDPEIIAAALEYVLSPEK